MSPPAHRIPPDRGARGADASQAERRREILVAASHLFAERGYRNTSWADVAERVYLTETSIHHYFESKQQCLFEVMAEGIRVGQRGFDELTSGVEFDVGFERIFRHGFEKTPLEACRNRVLMLELPLMRRRRGKPREEEAREMALEQMLRLERSGVGYLEGAMADGWIPKANPGLLWKAVFGLYESTWRWYRPDRDPSLPAIADHVLPQLKTVAGLAQRG